MKYLLLLLLIASPAQAQAYDRTAGIQGILDMHKAYEWGKLQNKLAAEAPPQRYQIENSYKVESPAYHAPQAYAPNVPSGFTSGAMDLQGLAKALANNPKVEKHQNSPFNDSYLPGVE